MIAARLQGNHIGEEVDTVHLSSNKNCFKMSDFG